MMRLPILILPVLPLALGQQLTAGQKGAARGSPTPGPSARPAFALNIATATTKVKMGSPVEISVTLTNNSDRPLDTTGSWLSATHVNSNWAFDVRDSRGKPVPRKKYDQFQLGVGSVVFSGLNPGQSSTDNVNLSLLYSFARPGKYLVGVSRKLPKENGEGVIKSNVITITITNPDN